MKVGLSREEIEKLLNNDEFSKEVREDEEKGYSEGVHGVPYFIINGDKVINGAASKQVMKEILLSVLNKENESKKRTRKKKRKTIQKLKKKKKKMKKKGKMKIVKEKLEYRYRYNKFWRKNKKDNKKSDKNVENPPEKSANSTESNKADTSSIASKEIEKNNNSSIYKNF